MTKFDFEKSKSMFFEFFQIFRQKKNEQSQNPYFFETLSECLFFENILSDFPRNVFDFFLRNLKIFIFFDFDFPKSNFVMKH